jgi:hypothetical protein
MKKSAVIWSAAVAAAAWFAAAPGEARAADGGAGALETIALPEQLACSVRGTHVWRKLQLELAPGIPYTELGGADAADVLVPVSSAPAPVGLRIRTGKLALEGLLPAAALPLRARESFVIGEVFLTTAATELHWTDAAPGELGIEVRLEASTVKAVKGVEPRLRARLRCGAVALQTGWPFDHFRAIGGSGLNAKGRLKAPGPVPISATAGGPPLVRLVPSRALSEAMTVLERAPGWTRIGVALADVILFGWTPASFVSPPPPEKEGGMVSGMGGLGLSGVGPSKMKTSFTCDHDIRLVAEAGKQRRIVGAIAAGAEMEAQPMDVDFAFLTVSGLRPVKGAKFLVRRAELEGCTNAPAP